MTGAPRDLLALLERQAEQRAGVIREVRNGIEVRAATIAELLSYAGAIATRLRNGLRADHGRCALLVLPNGVDFAAAFFGAMGAGLVPTPAPLARGARSNTERIRQMLADADPAVVLTTVEELAAVQALARAAGTPVLAVDDARAERGDSRRGALPDVAFVQYTSGSISQPKPIAVTHACAMAQIAQAAAVYGDTREAVYAGWVPLFHDMGLVTGLLRPLAAGATTVLLEPGEFVRDPASWLRTIGAYRATHTSAPNFGYELCITKIAPDTVFELGSLSVARNAGEPVRAPTLRRFTQRFMASGFDPRAFCPSYGLAEATLTVTTNHPGAEVTVLDASARAIRRGHYAPASRGNDTIEIVGCGQPLPHTTVEIVDDRGRALPSGHIGEIAISGPQVNTADAACVPGDIGFLRDGELFVVGRSAERFIVRGQNFFPSDVEAAISDECPALRPGRVVVSAFDLQGPARLVVVGELPRGEREQTDTDVLTRQIRRAATIHFGLAIDEVHIVEPNTLPVTSSGKLRRRACADMMVRGSAATIASWPRASSTTAS